MINWLGVFDWYVKYSVYAYYQGKAGTAADTEELACALQQHDLFIYFGHGSGMLL